ncbi:hypothetical protein DFJ73DRAFT_97423 [Zopfochytrium polystomum]|nr:hypothetical protein DFJ73DRAFT_97423 [Zopfochytrium polystomum]
MARIQHPAADRYLNASSSSANILTNSGLGNAAAGVGSGGTLASGIPQSSRSAGLNSLLNQLQQEIQQQQHHQQQHHNQIPDLQQQQQLRHPQLLQQQQQSFPPPHPQPQVQYIPQSSQPPLQVQQQDPIALSDVSPSVTIELLATQFGITRGGYLDKLSTSESAGTFWKRRFVVLAGDTIYLFRNANPNGDPVGYMKLDASSQAFVSEHGVGIFNVRTLHVPPQPGFENQERDPRDYRTWALQAEAKEPMMDWLADIKAAISSIRYGRAPLPRPPAALSASGSGPHPTSAGNGRSLSLSSGPVPPHPNLGRSGSLAPKPDAAVAPAQTYAPAPPAPVATPVPAANAESAGSTLQDHPYVISHTKVAAYLASLNLAEQPEPPEEFTQAIREKQLQQQQQSQQVPQQRSTTSPGDAGPLPNAGIAPRPGVFPPKAVGIASVASATPTGGDVHYIPSGLPTGRSLSGTPVPPTRTASNGPTPVSAAQAPGGLSQPGGDRPKPNLTPYTTQTFEIKNQYPSNGILSGWLTRNG